MYGFQEVHTNRLGGSTTQWWVIHEETQYKTKYIKKGGPPEPMGYVPDNWVFSIWAGLTDEERVINFRYGKELPAIKLEYKDTPPAPIDYSSQCSFSLGNCPATTTVTPAFVWDDWSTEKGNNPMKTTYNSACASIESPQSDVAIQRAYLLDSLSKETDYSWKDTRLTQLVEMFNIEAQAFPKTSQELLDAFKNGKFTVDQKKVDLNTKFNSDSDDCDEDMDYDEYPGSQFFGITFTDLPVADRKGYDAALIEYKKLKQTTKDTIMISDPSDGLAALNALREWKPAGKAN